MELTTEDRPFPDLVVDRGGPVVRLRLPGEASGHALDDVVLGALVRALRAAEDDAACCVVTLEGSPGTFSVGMDLAAAVPEDGAGPGRFTPRRYGEALARIGEVSRPVVAVVDGRALGGGVGLAAACDLVIATPRSTFALPEGLLGLVPAIAAWPLMRRIGYQRAYRLALTTEPVDAARARDMDLVDEVHDDPRAAVTRLARRLRHVEPAALAAIKAHFRRIHRTPAEAQEASIERLEGMLAAPDTRRRLLAAIHDTGMEKGTSR